MKQTIKTSVQEAANVRVSWKSLAPIFADVVISPWNLLVGGLLIQYLSTGQAILAIVIGYAALSLVFILYGGLGFKKRLQSSQILTSVFGSRFSRYAIPAVLAIGQIGWAAVNLDLGGRSLGLIIGLPAAIGIIVYAAALILMAGLRLHRLGAVKIVIVASSLALIATITVLRLQQVSVAQFLSHQPTTSKPLFWGISVAVASMISFATITPDFFQSVKNKRDIGLSTLLGLVIPGILTALLGCFLFFDRTNFNLVALIGGLSFPVFAHLFNVATNTDGAIALYTPAQKLVAALKVNFKAAILIAGGLSLGLALLNITAYLEVWLKVLALLFPVFIGITFPAVIFREVVPNGWVQKYAYVAGLLTLAASLAILSISPPVLIALVLPILIYCLLLQYRFIHA